MVTAGQALAHKRIIFLQLYLWIILFFTWSSTGHAKYSSPPEVVIPMKITDSSRHNSSPGWLSYSLHFGGQKHIITMKNKKNLISRNFLLYSYTDQGDLLEEQPFVQNDCYYHGYVDRNPESTVALTTCLGSLQGILEINGTAYEIMPKSLTSTFEHLVYKMNSQESESLPKRCGLTEEEMARQQKLQESNGATLKQSSSVGWWNHHQALEYFVVLDNKRFVYKGSNVTTSRNEVLTIFNGMNTYYVSVEIDLVLVGLEIWTEKNHINIEGNLVSVLVAFCNWKNTNDKERNRYDVIHLWAMQAWGVYLGLSYLGTVCLPDNNCAINSLLGDTLGTASFTIAHELGHNLGMPHDKEYCVCAQEPCIMSRQITTSTKFSNCSYSKLMDVISKTTCLHNIPYKETVMPLALCGNALVEKGEQCDCGSLQSCKSDQCCRHGCVMKPDAKCAIGPCCEDCTFMPPGTLCREKQSECDLPEWCNGNSSECPEDVYMEDGSPCSGGYCYRKLCNTHDNHCQKIFGMGATSAKETCFLEMNIRGDRFGNCGNDSYGYIKCNNSHVLCGRIQCENVTKLPLLRNHETVHWTHLNNVTCWTTEYHFGIDIADIGAVTDGTICGPDHVCIDRKCVDNSFMLSNCSSIQCNMQGVCNNKHHCHCDVQWKPPYCEVRGFGGSIDSGPAPMQLAKKKSKKNNYILLGVLLPFMLLVSFFSFIVIRMKSAHKLQLEAGQKQNQQPKLKFSQQKETQH